jgi:DNA-directed RNA polymerase subunit RPC12/RpoP
MAQCFRFVCDRCGDAIESWDEGKPYYVDDRGKKQYAYHPEPERELCVGVESPHLCLDCGDQFDVDSRDPVTTCPACTSPKIIDTFHLGGQTCPACKIGVFRIDPEFFCIS